MLSPMNARHAILPLAPLAALAFLLAMPGSAQAQVEVVPGTESRSLRCIRLSDGTESCRYQNTWYVEERGYIGNSNDQARTRNYLNQRHEFFRGFENAPELFLYNADNAGDSIYDFFTNTVGCGWFNTGCEADRQPTQFHTIGNNDFAQRIDRSVQLYGALDLQIHDDVNLVCCHAPGPGDARANNSTAFGIRSVATGGASTAVGNGARANGLSSTAFGEAAAATNLGTISLGTFARSWSPGAIAIGHSTLANLSNGIAIGQEAQAHRHAVAIGRDAEATAEGGVAFGAGSRAAAAANAFGFGAMATHGGAVAIGLNARSTRDNQLVFGAVPSRYVRTQTSTYTMPAVTYVTSLDAQEGAIELLTTDAAGNLATAAPPELPEVPAQTQPQSVRLAAAEVRVAMAAAETVRTRAAQTAMSELERRLEAAEEAAEEQQGITLAAPDPAAPRQFGDEGGAPQEQDEVFQEDVADELDSQVMTMIDENGQEVDVTPTAEEDVAMLGGDEVEITEEIAEEVFQEQQESEAAGLDPNLYLSLLAAATDEGETLLRIDRNEAAHRVNADDIAENRDGVALAMAMQAPPLRGDKNFAVSIGYGHYKDAGALGFSGSWRVAEQAFFSIGGGFGIETTTAGGRASVTFHLQ